MLKALALIPSKERKEKDRKGGRVGVGGTED
jgi:hypothetical protein